MPAQQSPAPVAGAVEALAEAIKRIRHVRYVCTGAAYGVTERTAAVDAAEEAVARLAALHPQPAPAVAVEQVEAWQKLKFVHRVLGNFAHAPQSDRADAYAIVGELIKSTWLAARSAPAVAVKAERELFEAWKATWRPERHEAWDGWMARAALAAAPAVAEKVPLTEEQIMAGWGHKDAIAAASASRDGSAKRGLERQLEVFTAGVHFAEQAHGIGSGSAQEGQAK